MIASLPMYDWPEVRDATDAWWAGVANQLGVTVGLDRHMDHYKAWRSPELLFSQTCGYPFTHQFRGRLQLVATPHYGVDGCDGPYYQSMVFAREPEPLETFRGRIAAFNTSDSMSGMLALKLVFARYAEQGRFFANAIQTGSHLASLAAVRSGSADICAIDAVCVALALAYRPDYLEGLIEIARSPMVPSLPYVTSSGDVAALRRALDQAFADPKLKSSRKKLLLTGYSILDPQAYEAIVDLETGIRCEGGLELL